MIEDLVNGAWETGLGTYSGTNTLARTSVKASSNAGSAVSLGSGTKFVFISPIAFMFTSGMTGFAGSGAITASGLTIATARLAGRTTASTGALEEISVGTGLGLSGGTLSITDAELTAIAGLTSASDRLPYFTGSGTAALATFTAGGRALVNSAGTSGTFPYFSGSNTVTLGTITAAGLAILDDADAAAQRTTLGIAGKQAIWIPATAMVPTTTNGAASGTVEMATNKNMFSSLDFDTTTQEFAQFGWRMPSSWNEGTVTFRPVWSHASTTTNFGVVFQLAGVACSDNDAGDVAFGTAQTSTDTGGTTNNIYIGPESSAITIAGSPAAGDFVFFQVARAPANGSDTMAIDARLHGIVLYITTDDTVDA
ncbi:MAG: hypothetical protein U1E23_09545 [Reyranellaceae bacterium]